MNTATIKAKSHNPQLQLVKEICQYIAEQSTPPSLSQLGTRFKLSPYHLQRTFKDIVGISPKQYAEQCRDQRLKKQLKAKDSISTALYDSGFGSSGALYTKVNKKLGMTPSNYQAGGKNLTIYYSIATCPLGKLLVSSTDKGICMVTLADNDKPLIEALHEEFPQATIMRDDKFLLSYINSLLKYLKGSTPHCHLPLDVQGTAFQKRVWQELTKITYGTTCTYEQVAQRIGKPKAIRAVANACANNPTSLVVPCHRVIRKDGSLGGYRWDLKRKKALLKMENETVTTTDTL